MLCSRRQVTLTDYTAGTACRRRGGMVLGYRYGLAMAHTTITMTTGREGGNEERPIHLLKPETGRCQPSPSTTVTALSIYSVVSLFQSNTVHPSTVCIRVRVYIYIHRSTVRTHAWYTHRSTIDSKHTRERIRTSKHRQYAYA